MDWRDDLFVFFFLSTFSIIDCRTPIAISTIAMLNSARKAVEQARRVSQNFTAAAGEHIIIYSLSVYNILLNCSVNQAKNHQVSYRTSGSLSILPGSSTTKVIAVTFPEGEISCLAIKQYFVVCQLGRVYPVHGLARSM